MNEPRVAIALLQSFCRDEALVGDILEEHARRQSRAWLWRQVVVAVFFGLPFGSARRSTRARSKMPMPIGGIGLLAIAMLITVVAPGAWWLIGVGIAGGFVVAAVLIARAGRRVPEEAPRVVPR